MMAPVRRLDSGVNFRWIKEPNGSNVDPLSAVVMKTFELTVTNCVFLSYALSRHFNSRMIPEFILIDFENISLQQA